MATMVTAAPVLLLLALMAAAAADRHPHSHEDSYGSFESGEAKYDFRYHFNDYNGNDFGHEKKRDGRKQKVTHDVGGYSGFLANVNYKGGARYDSGSYYDSHRPRYDSGSYYNSHRPRYDSGSYYNSHRPRYDSGSYYDSHRPSYDSGSYYDSYRPRYESGPREFFRRRDSGSRESYTPNYRLGYRVSVNY